MRVSSRSIARYSYQKGRKNDLSSSLDCQGTVPTEAGEVSIIAERGDSHEKVELIGIEPTTSGLQSQRSPN